MLDKAQIKYIQSLGVKKNRHAHGEYIIEGEKIVNEYLNRKYPMSFLCGSEQWIHKNETLLRSAKVSFQQVSERERKKISFLTTPNEVLAVVKMPVEKKLESPQKGFHLVLENLQDPGNFGTIIRTADWFGLESIICSEDCVDAYNPKVVQATMGSLTRIRIHYGDIVGILQKTKLPVFAAALQGENIFEKKFPLDAVLIIGNESKGISSEIKAMAKFKITIPKSGYAESLNAAVATGIALAIMRNNN